MFSQVEATVVVYSIMRNITALIRRDEKDMVSIVAMDFKFVRKFYNFLKYITTYYFDT